MKTFFRLFIAWLILLMPLTATAQFTPIQQAKDQANLGDQTALDTVLTDISAKGSTARRQVQSVLADAAGKKTGTSAAGRKIETIIGKLKTDLNGLINDYAKKNPPGNQLRVAFNSAQDTLNSIRRQASEVLDQIGFDKAADPNKLSGKYLDYQTEIKGIADAALQQADDRLGDRGTRETLKKDLTKLLQDTQQKIDINTSGFLAVNGDVLPSAIERVKKGVLDAFSKSMADRFKKADARGTDKLLDLSAEELREVQDAKKEMSDVVDRAIETIDAVTKQVSSSNIPTSSQLPGQNPLLEAKFKVDKQIVAIRASTAERIGKIKSRFDARTDLSALAKEVFDKEAEREKNRLLDTLKEYEDYFTAGDPSKKKYNKAKRSAIDAARGCDDFLCTVGQLVSDVGAGYLKATTGVSIQPNTFKTILGVNPGPLAGYNASATRYTGGAYGGVPYGAYGRQQVPFNPQCLGDAIPKTVETRGLAFVERAYAQNAEDPLAGNPEAGSLSNTEQQQNPYKNAEDFLYDFGLGGPNPTKSKTSTSTSSGFDVKKLFQNIAPWLNQDIQNAGRNPYFGNCYGAGNVYGGLPGLGCAYNSPFGAFGGPVGQSLGFAGSNPCISINSGGINQQNSASQLAAGFALLATADPTNAEAYAKAAQLVGSGPMTFDKLGPLQQILQGIDFYKLPGGANGSNPIAGLIYNMCAQIPGLQNNAGLIDLCKKMLIPTQTPGFNPNPNGTTTITDPDLLQVNKDTRYISFFSSLSTKSKCTDTAKAGVKEIELRTDALQTKYLANGDNTAVGNQILLKVQQLRQNIDAYNNACSGLIENPFRTPTEKASDTLGKVNEYQANLNKFVVANNCSPEAQAFVRNTFNINSLVNDAKTTSQQVDLLNAINTLKRAIDSYLLNCTKNVSQVNSSLGQASKVGPGVPVSSQQARLLVRLYPGNTNSYTVTIINPDDQSKTTHTVSQGVPMVSIPLSSVTIPLAGSSNYKYFWTDTITGEKNKPQSFIADHADFTVTPNNPVWCAVIPNDVVPKECVDENYFNNYIQTLTNYNNFIAPE